MDQDKPQKPDNYLVWAILSTILCCLPFGIVSIIYSSKVDNLYFNGQYEEALAKSKSAKTWAIVAAATALVGTLLYILFFIVLGFSGILNEIY